MRGHPRRTRAGNDRKFPHQVIFRWEDQTVAERRVIMESALGLDHGTSHARYLDTNYLLYCFKERADALAFRNRHNVGEIVDPSEFDKIGTWHPAEDGMCNLYRVTTNQESLRQITKAMIDNIGNLEPPHVLGGKPDTGVTNIRNVASSHWRRWLGPANRCVVPWTEFCEWEDTKPKKTKRWFAIDESRPLAFFAGIWTDWSGERGSVKAPRAGQHSLYGFLTCEPNGIVAPIHPKAMPVILTTPEEIDLWMTAPWEEAKTLQRPLPDDGMILLPVDGKSP